MSNWYPKAPTISLEERIDALLEAREQRAKNQKQLLKEKDGTLLTVKANYPGAEKRNPYTAYCVTMLYFEILKQYRPLQISHSFSQEGLIFYLLLDAPGMQVKESMIQLEEEHPLGRLCDVDVLTRQGAISRRELGHSPRKCFCCEEPAVLCSRSQKHSQMAVKASFVQQVEQGLLRGSKHECFGHLIAFGLIGELTQPYGFGCVGPHSQGSHTDMDFYLFLKSIRCLMTACPQVLTEAPLSFTALRRAGRRIEEAMFQATEGINTHKGALFMILLLLEGFQQSRQFGEIPSLVARLASELEADFNRSGAQFSTHGLDLYSKYGMKGIRGAAQAGFATLFTDSLPFYQKHRRRTPTMLYLMSTVEDTTILHRSNLEVWKDLQRRAGEAIHRPEQWQPLQEWCIQHRLSPGGSADSLAMILMLDQLQRYYPEWKGRSWKDED